MGGGASTYQTICESGFYEKYEFVPGADTLGSGAFATVKLAVNKNNRDEVAVKVIAKGSKLKQADIDSFRTEISILKCLDHPNTIKLIDVYEESSDYLIVNELVDQRMLEHIMSVNCYSEKDARTIVKQVLLGLEYIHQQEIVHRDIKLENLLMTVKNNEIVVKLSDFGFAKKCHELNLDDEPCGTPLYVAPEVLKMEGYGPAIDLWSAGVLFYILFVGYAPFYHEEQFILFRKIKKGAFKFHDEYWKNISDDAKDLITKLIVVDPYKRLNPTEALQHPYLETISEVELPDAVINLRKLQAIKRFKKVANGVIVTKRLSKVSVIDKAVGNRRNSKIDISAMQKLKIEEDIPEFEDDEIEIVKKDVPEIGDVQNELST